jgi:hypothetical protein
MQNVVSFADYTKKRGLCLGTLSADVVTMTIIVGDVLDVFFQLIFTVVIGSLAISCPRFFEFELIANVDGTLLLNNTVTFRSHPIYSVAYRMVASLLIVYLIPISALAGLNLRMWLALRRTIGRLHQQQQQHGTCGGRGAAVKCVNNASCKCPRCMSRRCHDNVWHDDRRRRPVPLHQQRNEVQDNAKESENELRRRRDAALINRSPRYVGYALYRHHDSSACQRNGCAQPEAQDRDYR